MLMWQAFLDGYWECLPSVSSQSTQAELIFLYQKKDESHWSCLMMLGKSPGDKLVHSQNTGVSSRRFADTVSISTSEVKLYSHLQCVMNKTSCISAF